MTSVTLEFDAERAIKTTDAYREALRGHIGSPVGAALVDVSVRVAAGAARRAPVDRGPLRASLQPGLPVHRPELGLTEISTGSDLKYAPYQELGTRPFWPPPGALEPWARRHGVSEYVVRRAIARRGIKAKKFLTNTIIAEAVWIETRLERGVREALR
jgi:hypothetical protein